MAHIRDEPSVSKALTGADAGPQAPCSFLVLGSFFLLGGLSTRDPSTLGSILQGA